MDVFGLSWVTELKDRLDQKCVVLKGKMQQPNSFCKNGASISVCIIKPSVLYWKILAQKGPQYIKWMIFSPPSRLILSSLIHDIPALSHALTGINSISGLHIHNHSQPWATTAVFLTDLKPCDCWWTIRSVCALRGLADERDDTANIKQIASFYT